MKTWAIFALVFICYHAIASLLVLSSGGIRDRSRDDSVPRVRLYTVHLVIEIAMFATGCMVLAS